MSRSLVFLYVRRFRCLVDCACNFDANYRFEVVNDELRLSSCIADPMEWHKFFSLGNRGDDPGGISNVSAIVGENGSGKTTLAFVIQQLILGTPQIGDCIAVYKCTSDSLFHIYQPPNQTRRIKVSSEIVEKCVEEDFVPWRTMVYYSPMYTTQRVIFGDDVNVHDISTTGILKRSHGVALRNNGRQFLAASDSDCFDFSDIQKILAIRKNGNFGETAIGKVHGLKAFPSPYSMAHLIQIAAGETGLADMIDDEVSLALASDDYEDDVDVRRLVLGRIIDQAKNIDSFVLSFTLFSASLNELAMDLNKFSSEMGIGQLNVKCYSFIKSLFKVTKTSEGFKMRILAFLNEMKNTPFDHDLHYGLTAFGIVNGVTEVFNILSKLPTGIVSSEGDLKIRSFDIDVDSCSKDIVSRLIKAYTISFHKYPYLEFSIFPQLSTGESAFLSFYGRLAETLSKIRCSDVVRCPGEILLFIDEGETALHPELQKNFIRDLIIFLERATESMNVQIMVASHSPMLLSDIPSGSVCFLENGLRKRHKIDWAKAKTFGANIYDLYREGFFLHDGTMGAFAEHKINRYLKWLADKTTHSISQSNSYSDVANDVSEYIDDGEIVKIRSLISDPILLRYISVVEAMIGSK